METFSAGHTGHCWQLTERGASRRGGAGLRSKPKPEALTLGGFSDPLLCSLLGITFCSLFPPAPPVSGQRANSQAINSAQHLESLAFYSPHPTPHARGGAVC